MRWNESEILLWFGRNSLPFYGRQHGMIQGLLCSQSHKSRFPQDPCSSALRSRNPPHRRNPIFKEEEVNNLFTFAAIFIWAVAPHPQCDIAFVFMQYLHTKILPLTPHKNVDFFSSKEILKKHEEEKERKKKRATFSLPGGIPLSVTLREKSIFFYLICDVINDECGGCRPVRQRGQ